MAATTSTAPRRRALLLWLATALTAAVLTSSSTWRAHADPSSASSGHGPRGITVVKYQETAADESVVFGPVPIAGKSGPNFAKGIVYDGPVLVGGQEVGRARGFYFRANLKQDDSVTVTSTVAFYKGDYAGSTFIVAGDYNFSSTVNSLAVTGGTGVFQFAKGSASYVPQPDHFDVIVTLKGVEYTPPV